MSNRIIPPPPPLWNSWESAMQLALGQAQLAKQANEVPVGAVVLSPEGKTLGQGYNRTIQTSDPSAHAEILALRAAGQASNNYRLYSCYLLVTLEPCLMCTGAIIHARLAGVIYGASDKKAGAITSCIDGLELPFHNTPVWHMGGICEQESVALLQTFFSHRR